MEFRIADTFTSSMAKLEGNEQKLVKQVAFDLQLNPAHPSLKFHRINKSKDRDFWSARVESDIRMVIHKRGKAMLLCYVGHHDDAYTWAERRRIETHPKTGAAQIVEVRERVTEIEVPVYIEKQVAAPDRHPLEAVPEDVLLQYGVPQDWISDIKAATEESLLVIVEHLPAEAMEAVLSLAVGQTPERPEPVEEGSDPFDHPDAQRRFRVFDDQEALERALDAPWETWAVFLHPAQQSLVERTFNGPARVAGSAGTGKTVVALHRAVFLARQNPKATLLLTTFTDALASALRSNLAVLAGGESGVFRRIRVAALFEVAQEFHEKEHGPCGSSWDIAEISDIRSAMASALEEFGGDFSLTFLLREWSEVIDAWQVDSLDAYRDISRTGRKARLGQKQREQAWLIFEHVQASLKENGKITESGVYAACGAAFATSGAAPFEFLIVDEAQDLSVAGLRFLAVIGAGDSGRLFFSGDQGQRIFQSPFSWKSLGVDIRGRSRTLRINYRTSHQIRSQADRLLPDAVADMDGNEEQRDGTISVFNGPPPRIELFDSPSKEIDGVGDWIGSLLEDGLQPHEIGIIVRAEELLERASMAVAKAGCASLILDQRIHRSAGKIACSTMHLAKGMEFAAVAVMACDDEVLPLQERIETVADEAELEEVYVTERHLLYVACTRARDQLLVSGVDPISEFLEDMEGATPA